MYKRLSFLEREEINRHLARVQLASATPREKMLG